MYTLTPRSNSTVGPSQRINMSEDGDVRRNIGVQMEGNLKNHAIIDTGEHTIMCCQYHKNGQILAVGLSDGIVKIYDPDTLTLLYTLTDPESQSKHLAVTSVRFLPAQSKSSDVNRNLVLVTYASGLVKLWHYTSQRSLFTVDEGRSTLCGTFNPDGSKFLTSGSDSIIQVYDMETRKKMRTCERSDGKDVMNGHKWRIFAIKYHDAHPRQFITGGWDNTVQFWDDREKHSVRKLFGPHICGDGLDIDPVNDHILTGSWSKDTPLQVWDYNQGTKITDVPSDQNNPVLLYCAQWHGRDYMICGGCDNNMAKVIDRGTLNTIGQITNLDQGVYCVDNTKQGTNPRFVVGAGNTAYVMQLARM